MKRAAAFVLCACTSGGSSAVSDSVLAEAKTPLAARVLQREHEDPVPCDGATGLLERLQCAFKSSVSTCTWLEIDSPELAVHPLRSEFAGCRGLPVTGARVLLSDVTGARADFAVSPEGQRVAVGTAPRINVHYVVDGWVVGQHPGAWPIDWSRVPALDAVLDDFLTGSDEATSTRLADHVLRTGGEARLEQALEHDVGDAIDRWSELYARLGDEGLRQKAREALSAQLHDPSAPLELLAGLAQYPELQPPDFGALLAHAAEESVSGYYDWYALEPVLHALETRDPLRAGELACRVFGTQVLAGLPGDHDEYEYTDPTARDAALTLVARSKAACPWVSIALESDPCSVSLRCAADGGYPSEALDESVDPEAPPAQPLCSPAVAARALVPIDDTDEGDGQEHPGLVLLAAAHPRGAVSKELLLRNARRMYRYLYPPAPDAGEDEASVEDPPCRRPRDLPESVCRLPVTVTDVVYDGCRLRIDDKAKVVRVEELKAK